MIYNYPMSPFGYTGQRNESYINLLDYNARFYSPHLGRFISADSIVPNPGDTKSYDRYSYVAGNPLRFNDPSGHSVDCGMGEENCQAGEYVPPAPPPPTPEDVLEDLAEVLTNCDTRDCVLDWIMSYSTYLADTHFPARSPATQMSLSGMVGYMAWNYGSISVVTTSEGDYQTFVTWSNAQDDPSGAYEWLLENGPALDGGGYLFPPTGELPLLPIASPQLGASVTGGRIFGEDLEDQGLSALEGESVMIVGNILAVSGDVYMSYDPESDNLSFGVYGYDLGAGPSIIPAAGAIIPVKTKAISPGGYVRGPLLLLCRILNGCGR